MIAPMEYIQIRGMKIPITPKGSWLKELFNKANQAKKSTSNPSKPANLTPKR